jgi:hypothetical protein
MYTLILYLILLIPLISFLLWFICYTNDRLYCFFKGIDYDSVKIVDYGYAKVCFIKDENQ